MESASGTDRLSTLSREDGLLWRLDEAVVDQLPCGRSGPDGQAARGRGHRGENRSHALSKRPLCAHSRSGRQPNRAVAADEGVGVKGVTRLVRDGGPYAFGSRALSQSMTSDMTFSLPTSLRRS